MTTQFIKQQPRLAKPLELVYHCYFDFDGPPTGAGSGGKYQDEPDYLEGIEADGQ